MRTTAVLSVIILSIALLFVSVNGRTLSENLVLSQFIGFIKSESQSSGAFLYDTALGGPGGVPASLNTQAQTLSADTATGMAALTGTDYTDAVTAATTLITGQSCEYTQFVSPALLSTKKVNIYDNVKIFSYYGPYNTFATTLQAYKVAGGNTTAANNLRRILTCPLYDNLAFGLTINTADSDNIAFVIIAVASDPSSTCASGNTVANTAPNYFCPSQCSRVASTSVGITYIPTPSNFSLQTNINSTEFATLWSETGLHSIFLSEDLSANAFTTVDYYLFDKTAEVTYTPPDRIINGSATDSNFRKIVGFKATSWLLQFNPGVAFGKVNGTVVFSNPIIGLIYTDKTNVNAPFGDAPNRVILSDPTFQPLCSPYDNQVTRLPYRGLEKQIITGGPRPGTYADTFAAIGNKFEIKNFTTYQAVSSDSVRILTACEDGPVCDPAFEIIQTSPNTLITYVTPPIGITTLSNNRRIYFWKERTQILSEPLVVDSVLTPGVPFTYVFNRATTPGSRPFLPAGTAYTSWYFHCKSISTGRVTYLGAIQFNDRIAGLVYRANPPHKTLDTYVDTDPILGDTCTEYIVDAADSRGLESGDRFTVDAAGTLLTLNMSVNSGNQDDLRVLTACTPSFY